MLTDAANSGTLRHYLLQHGLTKKEIERDLPTSQLDKPFRQAERILFYEGTTSGIANCQLNINREFKPSRSGDRRPWKEREKVIRSEFLQFLFSPQWSKRLLHGQTLKIVGANIRSTAEDMWEMNSWKQPGSRMNPSQRPNAYSLDLRYSEIPVEVLFQDCSFASGINVKNSSTKTIKFLDCQIGFTRNKGLQYQDDANAGKVSFNGIGLNMNGSLVFQRRSVRGQGFVSKSSETGERKGPEDLSGDVVLSESRITGELRFKGEGDQDSRIHVDGRINLEKANIGGITFESVVSGGLAGQFLKCRSIDCITAIFKKEFNLDFAMVAERVSSWLISSDYTIRMNKFNAGISMRGIEAVTISLMQMDTTFINLVGARISSFCSFAGSHVLSGNPADNGVTLRDAIIKGDLMLSSGFQTDGLVDLRSIVVENLVFAGGTFIHSNAFDDYGSEREIISAQDAVVNGSVFFNFRSFKKDSLAQQEGEEQNRHFGDVDLRFNRRPSVEESGNAILQSNDLTSSQSQFQKQLNRLMVGDINTNYQLEEKKYSADVCNGPFSQFFWLTFFDEFGDKQQWRALSNQALIGMVEARQILAKIERKITFFRRVIVNSKQQGSRSQHFKARLYTLFALRREIKRKHRRKHPLGVTLVAGKVNFERAIVKRNFICNGSFFYACLPAQSTSAKGAQTFGKRVFSGFPYVRDWLDSQTWKSDLVTDQKKLPTAISLRRTRVSGDLYLNEGDDLEAIPFRVFGRVDLHSSEVGQFFVNPVRGMHEQTEWKIVGMKYNYIYSYSSRAIKDHEKVLDQCLWFKDYTEESNYRQPYEQFAKTLLHSGEDSRARRVLLRTKTRGVGELGLMFILKSFAFLGLPAYRALVSLFGLWLLGVIIFDYAFNSGQFCAPCSSLQFDAKFLSAENMLPPLLSRMTRDVCRLEVNAASGVRFFYLIQPLIGTILSTMFLLGIGRIIRRS
ncbi:hypothetical protein [Dyadobacter fermentans]|uniref:Membrane-associated oxidoreductase n=1 Tax=Dyadobacter fermentans (strain ATCC 700827 / DSM 18053 / CIP 107007 / KCTC 52180 / NS114) TaxID=471854 RepID=C6VT96_DYAFD|nr:hypothetical protein [Dyadobacter fermentans]ACT96460.1 hypothetical protein Dfer_5266 [Dyadobacter fermentans DSM 18053]